MNEFDFSLPNEERILARIEVLLEYLSNFPDGLFADCARNELEQLENLQKDWFV